MPAFSRIKLKLLIIIHCMLAVGCANISTVPSGIMIANDQPLRIVFPALPSGVLTQSLLAQHKNNQHELLVRIEISAAHINFVGLSPSGLDLFTINWPKQGSIQYNKRPFVPDNLQPEFMLADFLLTFSKQNTLQKQLPQLHIEDQFNTNGKIRYFNQGQNTLINIKYSSLEQWPQQVNFEHAQRSYQLTINTLEWEPDDSN